VELPATVLVEMEPKLRIEMMQFVGCSLDPLLLLPPPPQVSLGRATSEARQSAL
jgi:hypothetical protein